MPLNSKPILFYDGGCRLCQREISFYRWLDRKQRIQWLDIHARPQALLAFDLSVDDAMRELHLQDSAGNWQIGVDAFIALWEQLPGFRTLAKLARWQPIYRQLSRGYRWFARRRYQQRCGDNCRLQ